MALSHMNTQGHKIACGATLIAGSGKSDSNVLASAIALMEAIKNETVHDEQI